MTPIPAELQTALKERRIVPFVGAGLSLTLGQKIFPDWKGLLERFAVRLEGEALAPQATELRRLIAASELVAAAEYALQHLPKPQYFEELDNAFNRARPAKINLSAVEAIWRLLPNAVITTNFERVLEWPFETPQEWPYQAPGIRPRVAFNSDPALLSRLEADQTGGDPLIWHLHGSSAHPDTIVLSTTDFSALYGADDGKGKPDPRNENALRVLTSVVARRPLLFVGFSLGDPFLLNQLRKLLALTAKNSPVSYLLVKKGEKDPTALLQEFQIQLVEFDDFGEPMLARLNEMVAFANPSASRIDVSDVAQQLVPLVTDLETRTVGMVPEPEAVAKIFNACKPDSFTAFPPSGDGAMLLRAAVARLASASRQTSGNYPLLVFINALADMAGSHGPSLRAWIETALDNLARDPQDRQTLRATLALPGSQRPAAPYVLVRILATAGEKPWSVRAWLFSTQPQPVPLFEDERLYAQTESEQLVTDLLSGLATHDVDEREAIVAFLLPRALMREEIHRWRPAMELGSEPALGSTFAVTVRSLERTTFDRARRFVQQQWQTLKSTKAALEFADLTKEDLPAAPAAVWITPEVRGGAGLVQRLRRWGVSHAVLAGLGSLEGSAPGAVLFDSVLQAGVPVIMWVRDADALSEGEIRALVTANPLLDLPRRLRERRGLEEERSEVGFGQKVALLWDAADYLPPDQDPENRAQSPV